MKKFHILSIALLSILAVAALSFGVNTAGTVFRDANNNISDGTAGIDSTKTVAKTVTGTRPVAFSNISVPGGVHRYIINCVTPTTGAAAAAKLKLNASGTEIPLNGVSAPLMIPSSTSYLSFNKYSTATATDAVKCTAYGH